MQKKVFIKTFGCQMNEYDSDKMADVLGASDGLVRTDTPEDADVILLNTCSVREKAQEKVFSDLGRLRELKLAKPAPVDRRRRLRGVAGRRRHRQARALCRHGVRPANPAPPAADDRAAPRQRRCAGRHQLPGNRKVRPPAAGQGRRRRRRSSPSWKAAASTAATASCPTRAARKCRAASRTC